MVDPSHQELRYRIADAINDSIKKIPGLHRAAKGTASFLARAWRRLRQAPEGKLRPKAVRLSENLPRVPRQKSEFAACTIIAKNYLPMARVLADSFHRFHPDSPFFVLLLDPVEGYFDPELEKFLLLEAGQLEIPDLRSFLFKYNILEASTAVKPYFLQHLFEQHDIRKLIYFDPDILILNSLSDLVRMLDEDSIILTPHITSPYSDNAQPGELDLLRSGAFNLGFIALRRSDTSKRLLLWWQDRVYDHCRYATELGMFVDQKWMDLVPGFFDDVEVLREPGYNVAYWNLHERTLMHHNGRFSVNGQPCYFFHFSGFNPFRPDVVSKHQNRFSFGDLGETRQLFTDYREMLLQKGWQESQTWPYTFDFYESGEPITPAARTMYWSSGIHPAWTESEIESETAEPLFGANVVGYVTSEKGVGEAMRASIRSLQAAGVPRVINNFVDTGSDNIEANDEIVRENPYWTNLVCVNADQLPYFARQKRGYLRSRYNVAYWNWELSWFPEAWRTNFAFLHEIWAPSNFVRDAILSISPLPVTRIPYAIDPDIQISGKWTRSQFGIPNDVFTFTFSFDFYSFMERKNPLGLIHAFRKAFGTSKDVLLVLKHSHSNAAPNDLTKLKEAVRNLNVRLIDLVLPRDGIRALMALSDCYVSLHRSEGFGLTLTEAMTFAKPVIATAYSGNMDFMNESNSFPVRYKLTEIQEDYGPYKKGKLWADPDLDHAAELMRFVYENPAQAAAVAKKGQEDVHRLLHPAVVGEMIRQRLLAIAAQQPIADKSPQKHYSN